MVDEQNNNIPEQNTPTADNTNEQPTAADNQPPAAGPTDNPAAADDNDDMNERLERLGGEPAPVITPEEFARLQKAGHVHIDAGGRVRTARRRDDDEGGVSLRKRRAWYAAQS